MIAAAKRAEQARLINFVRLSDYLITDGLRVMLIETLQDLIGKVKHNKLASKSKDSTIINLEDRSASINLDDVAATASITPEDHAPPSPEPSTPQETTMDFFMSDAPVPVAEIFSVDLVVENDVLIFNPSYLDYETKVSDVITPSTFTPCLRLTFISFYWCMWARLVEG